MLVDTIALPERGAAQKMRKFADYAATPQSPGSITRCSKMPTWMQCTTDGNVIRINLDHVVTIRPYQRDRGGKGSEITFAGGSPSSLVVREDQDRIASSRQKSTTDRLEAEPRQKMRGGHAVSGRLCSRLCIAFMQSAQELGYRSVTHRTLARLRAQQPTVAVHPIKVLPKSFLATASGPVSAG